MAVCSQIFNVMEALNETSWHVSFADGPMECLGTQPEDGMFSERYRQTCAKACRLVTEIERLHRNQRTALVGKRCLVNQVMGMKQYVDGWTNCPCFASVRCGHYVRQRDESTGRCELLAELDDLGSDISNRVTEIGKMYKDAESTCIQENTLGCPTKYKW